MRLTSSRAFVRPPPVPTMPPGLVELMNGLAKDVLFHNPTNVYEFCANHMEKLLEIRDGPSPKKSMTLEQKIQRAQEKLRQKAKERREKFDKDVILLSKQEATDRGIENKVGKPEADLKPSVHHELDLQNASEVEISHNPQAELTVDKNSLNSGNILGNEGETKNTISGSFMITENSKEQILTKDQIKQTENVSDKKFDVEPIFGKIEPEMLDAGQENKLEEIVNPIESSLQTITETIEESLVNEKATILPKITIGDSHEMCEIENISDESVQEVHSDVTKSKLHEDRSETANIENEPNKTGALTVPSGKITHIDAVITEEPVNVQSNLADNIDENKSNSSDLEKPNNEVSDPTHSDVVVNNIDDATASSAANSEIIASETQSSDSTKVTAALPNIPGIHDDSVEEKIHKEIMEQKDLVVHSTENPDITEKKLDHDFIENMKNVEEKMDSEQKNASETVNFDTNTNSIKIVKNETEIAQHPEKENEKTCGQDYDALHDNVEASLQKSDSTENTNEDGISIIESDISKTDDDSTQNNPNMDLETAAVTIQKVFRSFMFKSRNSTFEDNINDENNSIDEDSDKKEEYYAAANLSKERRTLGITRMDTVLQTVNEEKSLSLSTDDSSTLSSAATTIQAHVRGYLARNRLNSSKSFSTNSLVNSHEVLEADPEQHKNKTILNIHIVPEEGNYLSRDESLITSMDLSLDGSPPSSVNLHPLSFDITERRKMLKREDAVQSVSPPSNNSGKLSEDSVKEVIINENGVLERESTDDKTIELDDQLKEDNDISEFISSASTATPTTVITISKSEDPIRSPRENSESVLERQVKSFSADECDVITPYVPSPRSSEGGANLVHSGEFHDVVLPTKVSRNDTTVVRGE